MFRRRTFSSGNIHYRINIDKSMCPNSVDINRITWQGHLITSDHCITANACQECQSVAVGTGIYNNTYNVNIIIVAPS